MVPPAMLRRVGELSDVTAAQVAESQREFRKASDALAPFRRILDHHLKSGNSLIGEVAAAETVAEQNGQAALDGMSRWDEFARAVQSYMMVSQLADATADQVLSSRKAFQEAEEMLAGPRAECNVLTAKYFEKWTDKQVGSAQQAASDPDHPGRGMFDHAQEVADEHSFFHWPLEFPAVWYGVKATAMDTIGPKAQDEAGFDVVISRTQPNRIRRRAFILSYPLHSPHVDAHTHPLMPSHTLSPTRLTVHRPHQRHRPPASTVSAVCPQAVHVP